MPRQRTTIAIAALVLGACLAVVGFLGWGLAWQDRETFARAAKAEGWVEIGRFGDHWPARIRRVRHAYETVAFTRDDGSRHQYAGFHGYRLRVVFLSTLSGRETIVVQRAARRGRDADELQPER